MRFVKGLSFLVLRYMSVSATNKQVYDLDETAEIYDHLMELPIEFRQYKRYNKLVNVPRGQLAFTLTPEVHYDYGRTAGGTPSVLVMDEVLAKITHKVNGALNSNYNTVLLNYYRDGNDYISAHKDNTNGWKPNTGFATLAFGATRDFVLKSDTGEVVKHAHTSGSVIELPHPMNNTWTHAVPKRKGVKTGRISLTFREIASTTNPS